MWRSTKYILLRQTYILYRNIVTPSRNLDNMTSYHSRQHLFMLRFGLGIFGSLVHYNKRGQVEDFASNPLLSATHFLTQHYVNDSSLASI